MVETMAQPLLKKEINTYIFLDTETTGLPSPGNKTRITEISLLAYSQNELLTKSKQPRVCNELTLCFDPCRQIQPLSAQISGLHNDALDGLPTFKKQSSLIVSFLKSLPPSVCLVAHNGNNFDFPLLKAELKRSQLHEDLDAILCVDSLWAFRNLDGLPSIPPIYLNHAKQQGLPLTVTEGKKNPVSGAEMNTFNKNDSADRDSVHQHENFSKTHHREDMSVISNSDKNTTLDSNVETAFNKWEPDMREGEITPERSQVRNEPPNPLKRGSNDISRPESSVRKRLFVTGTENSMNSTPLADKDTCTYHDQGKACDRNCSTPKKHTQASPNHIINQQKAAKSYSLPKLYQRYFGQEPDVSHTAEDDCVTLVKVVRLKAKEFLAWCNQNSVPFKNIHPMY